MQLLINGILQIWNFILALGAAALVDKIGRRTLFLTSGVGMFVFFSAQTICFAVFMEKGYQPAANAVIAFIFLFYAAYDIAFTPLIVSYTVEILPFQIRAKGFTVFNFTISLALIFNQYVNPIALGMPLVLHYTAILIMMFNRCNWLAVLHRLRLLACVRSHFPLLLHR
jgi:MFS family permease